MTFRRGSIAVGKMLYIVVSVLHKSGCSKIFRHGKSRRAVKHFVHGDTLCRQRSIAQKRRVYTGISGSS